MDDFKKNHIDTAVDNMKASTGNDDGNVVKKEQLCIDCKGWDWTGHDCYRMACIHNKHKYGNVPGASDLWPHG